MTAPSVSGGLILGLALAAVVCTDPLLSHLLNLGFLERYPFLLTACVAGLGILAWLVAIRARGIWERQDVVVFILPIVLASQLVGLSLFQVDPIEIVLALLLPVWLSSTLARDQHPNPGNATL